MLSKNQISNDKRSLIFYRLSSFIVLCSIIWLTVFSATPNIHKCELFHLTHSSGNLSLTEPEIINSNLKISCQLCEWLISLKNILIIPSDFTLINNNESIKSVINDLSVSSIQFILKNPRSPPETT